MTVVDPTLRERWRSGNHVGAAKPALQVQIQAGLMDRHYAPFRMLDGSSEDFGTISGGKHNSDPWHAFWRSTGDWLDIPNVSQVDIQQQFDEQGVGEPATCTITIENVVFKQVIGAAGTFNLIKRGYLAPFYGFTTVGRAIDAAAIANEWLNVLNGGCRVRVFEGYGDAMAVTHMGLIDDDDIRATPDQIVVTLRDFGCLLTDQRVFGHNKAADIRSPIVFADRLRSEKVSKEGANAGASSTADGHLASDVLRIGEGTFWFSQGHSDPGVTEWVEIHVPRGRYDSIYVNPMYDGMELFVAIYAHSDGLGGKSCQVDGANVADGWIDRGLGNVPGANGGYPYVTHTPVASRGGKARKLGFTLDCGDGTTIRLALRGLGYSPTHGDYRAKVARLIGYRALVTPDAKTAHWILVDDAADVVKWVFMWCGFHEWYVEPLGVRLLEPLVFHQSDFMVDIVKQMVAQANYVYYMDGPTDQPDSIGVPHFERSRALDPPGVQEQVTQDDLLTGVETKFSKQNLSYIIRVRGKVASRKSGGVALGEDPTLRVQAVYLPPWSGAHHSVLTGKYDSDYPFPNRLAGVVKHETHTDLLVETEDEAMMMCLLIAIDEALSSFVGTVEVPGYPGFGLNGHASAIDTATGTNSRLWISNISSTFTTGESGAYTSTIEGAMIDTPDILALAIDYVTLLAKMQSAANE